MKTLLLLIILALSPLVAKADQITSGTYRFSGISSTAAVFNFAGENFSVNVEAAGFNYIGLSIPALSACSFCIAGTSVSLSSNTYLTPTDFYSGIVVVNGVSFPISTNPVGGTGSVMNFVGGTVVVPVTDAPQLTLTVPFTLVYGYISRPGFGLSFTNSSGLATLVLNRTEHGYLFSSLTYDFQTTPTPEPMTIGLLSSGLFALGLRLRKRK